MKQAQEVSVFGKTSLGRVSVGLPGRVATLTALSIKFERSKQGLRSRLANVGKLFFDLGFDITSLVI